jgi:hypothetical protein
MFANLNPADQQELVDSICDDPENMKALATFMFYLFQSSDYSPENYLQSSPTMKRWVKSGEDNGRGYFSENIKKVEYRGKVYSLLMIGIVDELLAYQATKASHDEVFFSKEEGFLQLKAAETLEKLNSKGVSVATHYHASSPLRGTLLKTD